MEDKLLARPEQLPPPGDWRYWIIATGRAWGRTWAGCRWINQRALAGQGPLLVVDTDYQSLRDRVIPEIVRLSPGVEWSKPSQTLRWPNGSRLYYLDGRDPEPLRGGRWGTIWARQPLYWRLLEEMWRGIEFGAPLLLPSGESPRLLVTQSAPENFAFEKVRWLKALMRRPDAVVVRGRLLDNRANLDPEFVKAVTEKYAGTELGKAILDGKMPAKPRKKEKK